MRERLKIKSNKREQEAPQLEKQVRGLASAALKGVASEATGGVETHRKKETPRERMERYVNRMIIGKNAWRGGRSSVKPHKYDTKGYAASTGETVAEIVEEKGEMPNELYGVAHEAVSYLNDLPDKVYDYDFINNDPRGVEAAGVLQAITRTPTFIEKPEQAATVLTSMNEGIESLISHDLFTHYDSERRDEVLNDGYSQESLPAFEALIAQDKLWERDEHPVYPRVKAKWALASTAQALNLLAKTSPLGTIDARLDMLTRNQVSGCKEGMVDYHLVYSFKTDIEQDQLQQITEDENLPEEKRKMANDLLRGAWDNVAWAI